MDQKALLNTLMSDDTLNSVSRMSGASTQQVQQVLSAALPSLLQGAQQQVGNSGFAAALADHAKDDTADLGGFFSHVDMTDGGKIVGHLLGDQETAARSWAISWATRPRTPPRRRRSGRASPPPRQRRSSPWPPRC